MAEDKIATDAPARPPMPEYELDSYDPVEFTMPHLGVSDEQIEAKMMEIADKYGAEYVPTERQVVGPKEDIEIDLEITKDGEVIENLTAQNRLYTVGEGLMPIDFDRNILGMKVGETKEFDFIAPDFDTLDKPEERPFHGTVTIKRIMKKVIPQITDEWVAKYMPMYKSAADFKKNVREGLQQGADQMVVQEKNARAAHALGERFHGAIDDFFYEEARASMMASYEQQAKSQGMDLEDFIGKQGMDQNQFSMMLMMQVRSMLVEGFSLDAWARHYNLEATEDDLKELAEMMAPQGRSSELLARLEKDPAEREAFELAAKRYVANKDLTARAKITYDDNAM